jgi:pyruvate/2-oxoglutarate/acetoin dehydrogenase E1 component
VIAHKPLESREVSAGLATRIYPDYFVHKQVPIEPMCGVDMPFLLAHEPLYAPGIARCLDALERNLDCE